MITVSHVQKVVHTHAHKDDCANGFNSPKLVAHHSEKKAKEWTNFKHYGQENIEPDHQIAAESKHRSYCDADG